MTGREADPACVAAFMPLRESHDAVRMMTIGWKPVYEKVR